MIGLRFSSVLAILASSTMVLGGPAPGAAQSSDTRTGDIQSRDARTGDTQTGDVLVVYGPDDTYLSFPVGRLRGYATVSHRALDQLGWEVEVDRTRLRAQLGLDGPVVEFSLGSPLFRWDDELLQMVSPPFSGGGSIQIPLQFVVDFLPARAGEAYAFSPDERTLEILDASLWPRGRTGIRPAVTTLGGIATRSGGTDQSAGPGGDQAQGRDAAQDRDQPQDGGQAQDLAQDPAQDRSETPDPAETQDLQKRVVVIDPGHGGGDPGTTGNGGRREKDIALAIGRYLERELRGEEDFEVYMTRDRDQLVPLWERGPQANLLKGARFGVFISIHVNSSPSSPAVRGFETYFLSDARTEHEQRVEAIENAPLQSDVELNGSDVENDDLTVILKDIQKFDHQHWSSDLAEEIQAELEDVHPGPNRGVKQGQFAVITNVLMPAVLVEVGFISNREEERVLSRGEFQREVAVALAEGVRGFFERYPPGQGVAAQDPPR